MAVTPPLEHHSEVVPVISDRSNVAPMSTVELPAPDGVAPSFVARRYRFGCWLVIEGEGEVDIATVPSLRRLLDGDYSHVIFDLRRVSFLDASGLGLLVDTRRRMNLAHGAVRVAGPSHQTRKLLALTAVDRHIPVFATLGQAFTGHDACGQGEPASPSVPDQRPVPASRSVAR